MLHKYKFLKPIKNEKVEYIARDKWRSIEVQHVLASLICVKIDIMRVIVIPYYYKEMFHC